jgi:membrane-bound lytic murein transglycosylase B
MYLFNEIKAGIKEKIQRILKNLRTITAVSLATKLVFFVSIFALLPMTATSAHQDQANYDSKISFNKANATPLTLADNSKVVEIGPSREDIAQKRVTGWVEINGQIRPTKSMSNSDPTEFRPIYQAAAKQFNIPWQLIEAVHQVETGKSESTAVKSYAGAQGPMQFMPGTWRAYAVDGNGDGIADITDVNDAIYTGANYLAKSGADEGRIEDAIFNYNHSQAYVNKVKTIALEIGM